MTSQETKVAVLENRMHRVETRLKSIDEHLASIVKTLAEMSGGKKAILGLCTLIGMAIGAIGGVVAVLRFWKGA